MRLSSTLRPAVLALLALAQSVHGQDSSDPVSNVTDTAGGVVDTVPDVVNSTLGNGTTCYSGVRLFVARGTLETQGESAQQVYVRQILSTIPDSFATEVVYPAAPFYFPLTFISSVLAGISNAQNQIYTYHDACPDSKIVLMGYSQGARVMGHAIAGSNLFKSGDAAEPVSIPMSPLCASAARNGEAMRPSQMRNLQSLIAVVSPNSRRSRPFRRPRPQARRGRGRVQV